MQHTLRLKNIEKSQNIEEYTDPIDLTNIFYKRKDTLYEWIREDGEPVLDEASGQPSSYIANEIGVEVDDFMETIIIPRLWIS